MALCRGSFDLNIACITHGVYGIFDKVQEGLLHALFVSVDM